MIKINKGMIILKEIKYKAFLKNKNEIIEVTKINFVEHYIEYIDERGCTLLAFFQNIKLLEFSGLYDKKEKAIFEGDIINYCNNFYTIIFNYETASYVAYNESTKERITFKNGNNKEMLIVGNVFVKTGKK